VYLLYDRVFAIWSWKRTNLHYQTCCKVLSRVTTILANDSL